MFLLFQVLFSDETHFCVSGSQAKFVRRASGDKLRSAHINQTVKHPTKVMFWGSFCAAGTGRLHLCEGMMNSSQYCEVIAHRVVPEMQQRFPDGDGIFQQDLAPCHTSKMSKKKFDDAGITVMEWPGNSPDINPIENLWAIVKQKLQMEDITTKNKLIRSILNIWNHNDNIASSCKKLVNSMPKRVQDIITAKGGHIKY